jgi:hypothetical protein
MPKATPQQDMILRRLEQGDCTIHDISETINRRPEVCGVALWKLCRKDLAHLCAFVPSPNPLAKKHCALYRAGPDPRKNRAPGASPALNWTRA